jgi:hypothetical protein
MIWVRNWLIVSAIASLGISIFYDPTPISERKVKTKSERFFGVVGKFLVVFPLIGVLLGLIVYLISNFLPTWVGVTVLILVAIVCLFSVLPESKAEVLFSSIALVLLLLVIAVPIVFILHTFFSMFGTIPDIRNLFKCDGACVSASGESDSVPPFYFLIPMFMMLGFIISRSGK